MDENLSVTERWLVGELIKLSQQVSRFAVRSLGADVEMAGPPNIEDEFQLGSRLVELGTVIVARATEQKATRHEPQSTATSMHENTRNLLNALQAINEQLPRVASGIVSERITPQEQVEFAELVIRVGELIKLHAWEVRGYT